MEVSVRFFAGCREATKRDEARIALPEGATLADLQKALADEFPVLVPYVERVRYSVNWDYVGPEHPLRDRDEVAMIPPVAGGAGEG